MANATNSKKKPAVKLEDVSFYFDSVERDRLDAAGWSRKTGEILALRDKLLRLDEEAFDAAVGALKGILSGKNDAGTTDEREARARAQQGLYADLPRGRQSSGGGAAPTGKVTGA